MKTISLDMASKTGFAIFKDKKLLETGIIVADTPHIKFTQFRYDAKNHPYDYLDFVLPYVKALIGFINEEKPDLVIIEQTNKGRNRWTQKLLEWIHLGINIELYNVKIPVIYIDTISWRGRLGAKLSKEDKKENRKKKKEGIRGKFTTKHASVRFANETFNLKLKINDNDIADAICIGYAVLSDLKELPKVKKLEWI